MPPISVERDELIAMKNGLENHLIGNFADRERTEENCHEGTERLN